MGRAIQVVRTDRGWSRRDFAERTQLSYSFLSEIENGVKEPSSRTFALIADALDVAPGALLYDAERRLAEAEDASGEATLLLRAAGTTRVGADLGRAAGERSRSPEDLEVVASYMEAERSSSDTARAAAQTGPGSEAAPRIQRSRRVLDWLAGPLARRSSANSGPSRAGSENRDNRTMMDFAAQPTEPASAESDRSVGSVEPFFDALLPLLSELSPEDRELVLDLARRLARPDST